MTTPSKPHSRILLVEDDRKLSRLLADYFETHGFVLEAVHDGREGLSRASSEAWDLVVLDVMLPGVDGLSILRHLRQISDVPILMLTARGGEEQRIAGLDDGADDYLPKTISARELVARAKALLRRAQRPVAASLPEPRMSFGGLESDAPTRRAYRHGQELLLTATEFDLLLVLVQAAGRVVSREQLLTEARARDFEEADRSIDVHIGKLRAKLGCDPKAPRHIRTVRGVGYALLDCP